MKKKIFSAFLIFIIITSFGNIYAHSGRTDSYGGHKDKNNVSGLGPYHYHCGGHPAHLHPNGVCPYSNNSNKKEQTPVKKENKKVEEKTNNTEKRQVVEKKEVEIVPEKIKINEEINEIEVNEEKKLTATVEPIDAKNKEIKWETSDSTIAIIDSFGNIVGKKEGMVIIKAIASNGLEDKIIINVKEKDKEIEKETEKEKNVESKNDPGNEILGAATMGGVSLLGYKLLKKKKL